MITEIPDFEGLFKEEAVMPDSMSDPNDRPASSTPPKERLAQIRRSMRLGPKQKEILKLLGLREGSGFTLGVLMLILQFGFPLHLPSGPVDWWTVGYVAFLAVLSNAVTVWYVFCQTNAVDVATRDDTPPKDTQGTADNGWSTFPIYAIILLLIFSGFGWFLDLGLNYFAQNPGTLWARDRLILSWPMLIYCVFVFIIVVKIDLKILGPLFQRLNNFRGRHTRIDVDGPRN